MIWKSKYFWSKTYIDQLKPLTNFGSTFDPGMVSRGLPSFHGIEESSYARNGTPPWPDNLTTSQSVALIQTEAFC